MTAKRRPDARRSAQMPPDIRDRRVASFETALEVHWRYVRDNGMDEYSRESRRGMLESLNQIKDSFKHNDVQLRVIEQIRRAIEDPTEDSMNRALMNTCALKIDPKFMRRHR